MARPPKKELDYFPFDVKTPNDDKVRLLRSQFGLKGYAIYTLLLCRIYGTEGYYCKWTEDEALLFAHDVGSEATHGLVNDVVQALFKRDLFNEDIFNRHKILTSKGIQERYQQICRQLKRPFDIRPEYDCRMLTQLKQVLSPEKTEFPPEETPIIQEETTQKKGKERKGKESNPHDIFLQMLFADTPDALQDRNAVCLRPRCLVTDFKTHYVEAFNAMLHTKRKEHKTYHEWLDHLNNWFCRAYVDLRTKPPVPAAQAKKRSYIA